MADAIFMTQDYLLVEMAENRGLDGDLIAGRGDIPESSRFWDTVEVVGDLE